ncbi:hypothetical protein ACOMHN_043163 [Nucella lapillus]
MVKHRFVSLWERQDRGLCIFFLQNYFIHLTIYSNFVGHHTNDATLKVAALTFCPCHPQGRRPDLLPMKVEVILMLLEKRNNLQCAAFTHNCNAK